MVLISVTRLHLRAPLYLPAFLWHNILTVWQILNTPGFLSGKLWKDEHGAFWTLTAWRDELAMRNYRNSGSHRQAMRHLPHWCDEAAVVHWQQEDSKLPDAGKAYRRMVVEGHFTKVLHPSVAHMSREIPDLTSAKAIALHPLKKKGDLYQCVDFGLKPLINRLF
ncbi:antibiotic biosynthesis monooxygenase family protein [Chlorogloeopsis sp. ULAP02]|uniref:antibiotic biosynthesis monooxygenase family protein n=1 Tax=Chlorogloeopsis sp. ULAP02 TaxID=3107926 RepID=UPI003135383E